MISRVIQPSRLSVFSKPVFKLLKTGPYFVEYIGPYTHKDMHTYTHIHTMHTQSIHCGTV